MSATALPTPPLLIRADASTHLGAGHVMRCLALAQAYLAQGGEVTFLGSWANDALQRRIEATGCQALALDAVHPDPVDRRTTLHTLERLHTTSLSTTPWLVLDGYHFDSAYQQAIREAGFAVLVLDDNAHLATYNANIVLNQNIHAATLRYHAQTDTHLLLGPRYALLRPEFSVWRDWQRSIPPRAQKILVTLGGSDPANVTQRIAQALCQVDVEALEITVVLGGHYRHQFSPGPEARGWTWAVRHQVTDMAPLMAWADIAVAAGGSTCWELACLGLPTALVVLAENQRQVAQGLDAAGVSLQLGWHADLAPSTVS